MKEQTCRGGCTNEQTKMEGRTYILTNDQTCTLLEGDEGTNQLVGGEVHTNI